MAVDPPTSFFATQLLAAVDAAERLGQAIAIQGGAIPTCQLATMDRGSRWNVEKKARVFQGALAEELIAAGICEKVEAGPTTLLRRKVTP